MAATPMSIDRNFTRALSALNEARDRRERLMPNQEAALRVLYMAWERLKDFGWNDPIYCPKDGTHFDVIELGSVGVFDCHYSGEWPDGYWMTADANDLYPSSRPPAMYLPKKRVA